MRVNHHEHSLCCCTRKNTFHILQVATQTDKYPEGFIRFTFVCIVSDPKVCFLLIPYFKHPFKMYIGLKLLQE